MKRTLKTLFLASCLFLLPLSSCSPSESGEEGFDKTLVSSVSISPQEATLEIGESVTFTPSITYQKEGEWNAPLTWVTSDPLIVSIENGLATALSGGEATISVIAGYKMASASIYVSPGETPFTMKLNESELNLGVGETYQLIANTSESASIIWTSDNEEVASVSSVGLVTALKEGGATISASSHGVSVRCAVIVSATGSFRIYLNTNGRPLDLRIGETYQLVATTSEPAEVSFSSSNPSVASVSASGFVSALKVGSTTIKASANGVSATCIVNVKEGEDEDYDCTIYFFVDYNNIDPDDTTGTKLLAKFSWYTDQPLLASGKIPSDPSSALDPAFPYFIGWSSHTIIDSKDDLWDMANDTVGNSYFLYLYGIWSDVPKGEFIR